MKVSRSALNSRFGSKAEIQTETLPHQLRPLRRHRASTDMQRPAAEIKSGSPRPEALDFAVKGKVKVMAETYLLADAPKAYQRVAEGKPRFRAVLTM